MLSHITNNFVWNNFEDIESDCLWQWSFNLNLQFTCIIQQQQYHLPWLDRRLEKYDMGHFCVSSHIYCIWQHSVNSPFWWWLFVSSWLKSQFPFEWRCIILQNGTSNTHITSEWAFLINVMSFDCIFWHFEAKSYFLPISDTLRSLLCQEFLGVLEDAFLLLECSLILNVCHI